MSASWNEKADAWEVSFYFVNPLNHKRGRFRRLSPHQSKKETLKWEAEQKVNYHSRSYWEAVQAQELEAAKEVETVKEKTYFRDLAQRYLHDVAKTRLKPSTWLSCRKRVTVHLLPAFGDKLISDISRKDLDLFVGAWEGSGKSLVNTLGVFRQIMVLGVSWGLLDRVPSTPTLKPPKPSWQYLTQEEVKALLAAASQQGDPLNLMLLTLLANTGMRLGEACALRWSDIDFTAGIVRINRSRVVDVETSPKSGKGRVVPLTSALRAALEAYRLEGWEANPEGYVLWKQGEPIKRSNTIKGVTKSFRLAGLEAKSGCHVLRHTYASFLSSQGVPLRSIQALLGHSSIAQTERYAHLAPDHFGGALRALDNL